MHLKLIACNVLLREICFELASSPHTFDLYFTEKGDHEDSTKLRSIIQKEIQLTEEGGKPYDAILLGYGLCGNSTVGLHTEKLPMVLPRAHDCCTLFLGSKDKFKEYFSANPSRPFATPGYAERGKDTMNLSSTRKFLGLDKSYEEYVALYGEENAQFIIQTLTAAPQADSLVVYIEMPATAHLGWKETCQREAEKEGKQILAIPGDPRLIHNLIYGNWNAEEFLLVPPRHRIIALYDWDRVIESQP